MAAALLRDSENSSADPVPYKESEGGECGAYAINDTFDDSQVVFDTDVAEPSASAEGQADVVLPAPEALRPSAFLRSHNVTIAHQLPGDTITRAPVELFAGMGPLQGSSPRPKALVLCLDGTRNEYGPSETNVLRFYELLDQDNQRTYYQPGGFCALVHMFSASLGSSVRRLQASVRRLHPVLLVASNCRELSLVLSRQSSPMRRRCTTRALACKHFRLSVNKWNTCRCLSPLGSSIATHVLVRSRNLR